MEKIILKVEGMSCSHCENAVKTALSSIDGVNSVDVSLENKTVSIDFDKNKTDDSAFINAIEDEGYDVIK